MHLRPALTSVSQRCSWEMHFARFLYSASILLLVSSQCTLHMPQKNFTKNGKDTTDIEYFKVSALRHHVSSRLIIVNVLEIPIQIQFGLEKSMTIAKTKIQYNKDTIIFNVFLLPNHWLGQNMGWQSDRIVNTRTCIHKTLYKFQARESQFFILDRTE